jgi:hypothetical protein
MHTPPVEAGYVHATEPVVHDPHPDALFGLLGEGFCELVADLVVGDDVVVEVDPALGLCYGREPMVVGVGAVL